MSGLHIITDNQAIQAVVASQLGIANAAGGSAGASVTTAVSFSAGLPANYFVSVTPSQACFATVTGKTSTGFNVTLTPASPGGVNATLAAGTFDVAVIS
jgi:hypothetical protein